MSSYILIGNNHNDKQWWNDLVRACAVIGDTFEIHCWPDETEEIKSALKYGKQVKTAWSGIVIRGTITSEFLAFLTDAKKPEDTQIYNKMTPFFTVNLGNRFNSDHYGTEVVLSKVARKSQPAVDRVLDQVSELGIVHRNVG